MKEIEFRAWLKVEKKMVDVKSISLERKFIVYTETMEIDNENIEVVKTASFDEIELIQYTGLKDKNGVKIFEGDIVRLITSDVLYKVIYDEDDYCFKAFKDDLNCLFLPKFKGKWFEVIGNIYDNPELLGETNG